MVSFCKRFNLLRTTQNIECALAFISGHSSFNEFNKHSDIHCSFNHYVMASLEAELKYIFETLKGVKLLSTIGIKVPTFRVAFVIS